MVQNPLIQINDCSELQLSTAIKKVLIRSDNCDDTGTREVLENTR